MTTPLRQDLIRLANEVPALRQHLLPLIRSSSGQKTAEDYDSIKDRALEQGTWRNRQRRTPTDQPPAEPQKFRKDHWLSPRFVLRGVMDMGFKKPRPYEAQFSADQSGSGVVTCTMGLGALKAPAWAMKGATPPLNPVAKALASKHSHVFWEADNTGGMQLRGEYVLPGGTPGKASKPVSDMKAAQNDFMKVIKQGWR